MLNFEIGQNPIGQHLNNIGFLDKNWGWDFGHFYE